MKWTSWQTSELIRLVEKGLDVKYIAQHLGMTRNRVKNKLYRMNVEGGNQHV